MFMRENLCYEAKEKLRIKFAWIRQLLLRFAAEAFSSCPSLPRQSKATSDIDVQQLVRVDAQNARATQLSR